MNRLRLTLFGALFALCALPVVAHHSAAMFDSSKTVTLQGTVKSFQWVNPHCFIQLTVPEQRGTVEWSIEMGAPSNLFRSGWRQSTVRPGQQVSIVIHPVRDESRGGLFVSGTAEDGSPLGTKTKAGAIP
jgi:hypothetical protein